jgi:predicted dehydrogenase
VKKSDLIAYGLKMKIGLAKPGDTSSVPVQDIPIEKGEPLALELADFVSSVKEAKQPKVGGALGKSALEVAITITEQIKNAKR